MMNNGRRRYPTPSSSQPYDPLYPDFLFPNGAEVGSSGSSSLSSSTRMASDDDERPTVVPPRRGGVDGQRRRTRIQSINEDDLEAENDVPVDREEASDVRFASAADNNNIAGGLMMIAPPYSSSGLVAVGRLDVGEIGVGVPHHSSHDFNRRAVQHGTTKKRQSSFHRDMDQVGRTGTFDDDDNNGFWCRRIQCMVRLMMPVAALALTTTLILKFGMPVMHMDSSSAEEIPPPTTTPPTIPTPHPTRAPVMSSAPTSFQWVLSTEIIGDVETFGFAVDFDRTGKRIAVAAPYAHDGRGQLQVYARQKKDKSNDDDGQQRDDKEEETWITLGQPIIGDIPGIEASFGMDLSPDGNILAVGYPGSNGTGFVRIFEYTKGNDRWTQRGQALTGPSLGSRFGSALSLNQDGTKLIVGAPLGGVDERGMFQAYEWKTNHLGSSRGGWMERGEARYGQNPGDRFALSVGMDQYGDTVVVGAPNYDPPNKENAGMVQVFQYITTTSVKFNDGCLKDCWTDISMGKLMGYNTGSCFGRRVSSLIESPLWPFYFVSSSGHQVLENGISIHTDEEEEEIRMGSSGQVRYVYLNRDGFLRDEDPIPGLYTDEGLGYDIDLDNDKFLFCATTVNDDMKQHTGVIRCYSAMYKSSEFVQVGEDIPPLMKGNGMWLGNSMTQEEEDHPAPAGPSVAVVENDKNTLFATGYQSVVIHDDDGDGTKDVPGIVRMYRLVETVV